MIVSLLNFGIEIKDISLTLNIEVMLKQCRNHNQIYVENKKFAPTFLRLFWSQCEIKY